MGRGSVTSNRTKTVLEALELLNKSTKSSFLQLERSKENTNEPGEQKAQQNWTAGKDTIPPTSGPQPVGLGADEISVDAKNAKVAGRPGGFPTSDVVNVKSPDENANPLLHNVEEVHGDDLGETPRSKSDYEIFHFQPKS